MPETLKHPHLSDLQYASLDSFFKSYKLLVGGVNPFETYWNMLYSQIESCPQTVVKVKPTKNWNYHL